VFEVVADTGGPGALVTGTDFIEEIEGDVGDIAVGMDEDFHPVGEGVLAHLKLLCRQKGTEQQERPEESLHETKLTDGSG
jgi:hypothetical protein